MGLQKGSIARLLNVHELWLLYWCGKNVLGMKLLQQLHIFETVPNSIKDNLSPYEKEMTTQTPATLENIKWLGSGFSQNFDSGSERKTQNPAGVDSGTLDPWPPLLHICTDVQFVAPSLRSSAEITCVRTDRKRWRTNIDRVADEYGQLLCLKRRGFALREREIYTFVMGLACKIFIGCEGEICSTIFACLLYCGHPIYLFVVSALCFRTCTCGAVVENAAAKIWTIVKV